MKIKKEINVVWIGGEISGNSKTLFEKNKLTLPDYTFKLWDDALVNELVKHHPIESFVRDTISMGKQGYAFASDAIKLIILEKYGGWALDADVEIFKSFDPFLHHNWITGFEKCCGDDLRHLFGVTAVWGSVENHSFTKLLLEYYKQPVNFVISRPNSHWMSDILHIQGGLKLDNTKQYLEKFDVDVYPSEYFCVPFHEENTYAQHLFNGSWK